MLRLLATILLAVSSSLTAYSYLPAELDLASAMDNGVESVLLLVAAFLTGALLVRMFGSSAGMGMLITPITLGTVGAVIAIIFPQLSKTAGQPLLLILHQLPAPDFTRLTAMQGGEFILRAAFGYSIAATIALIITWLYGIIVGSKRVSARPRQSSRINPDDLRAAWWVSGHDDLREVFDRCEIIKEKMPHIHQKLQVYWGYPEFFEYIDSLLTMERGREDRQGFDARITDELITVRQVFVNKVEQVMAPDLKQEDRQRIRTWVQRCS